MCLFPEGECRIVFADIVLQHSHSAYCIGQIERRRIGVRTIEAERLGVTPFRLSGTGEVSEDVSEVTHGVREQQRVILLARQPGGFLVIRKRREKISAVTVDLTKPLQSADQAKVVTRAAKQSRGLCVGALRILQAILAPGTGRVFQQIRLRLHADPEQFVRHSVSREGC